MKVMNRHLSVILCIFLLSTLKMNAFDYEVLGHSIYRNYLFCPNGEGQIIIEAIDLTDKDITIPDMFFTLPTKVIVHGAFSCTDIETVRIPSSIKIIGTGAFYRCKNLKEVSFEEGLEKIDAGAFGYCDKLEEIELPASIKHVSRSAFIGCSQLRSIRLRGNINLEDLYDTDITGRKNDIQYDFEQDGIRYRIISYTDKTVKAVDASRDITSVEIPSTVIGFDNSWTVAGIGQGCFSESQITSVKLPSSIKHIDGYAFYGCTALGEINLPDGLNTIGEYAFCMNTSIKTFTFPESLTTIGEGAFYRCVGLKEISIPQSLKKIPDHTFYGCHDANIIFPEASVLTTVGRNAFFDNVVITELNIPESVETMGNIGYFPNLKSVSLPSNLKEMGAIHHCPSLTSIVIPDNIKDIPHFAFLNDESLESIHWPKFFERILVRAFANTGFTTIEMPDTVWKTDYIIDVGMKTFPNKYTIFDGAFSDCHRLESIDLNRCCGVVSKDAFKGCEQLMTVKVRQSTPPDFWDTFEIANESEEGTETCFSPQTYLSATLQIPEGSKEEYASASNWKSFTHQVETFPKDPTTGINNIHASSTEFPTYYGIQGHRLSRPQKGINIIYTTDGKTRKVIIK